MPHLIAPTGHLLDLPSRHLTFGSSPACDIPLQGDYELAPLHFELAPGSDGFTYLRDASGGQTRVNGQPVITTFLNEGDVIEAGKLTLRFGGVAAKPVSTPVAAASPMGIAPSAAPPETPSEPVVTMMEASSDTRGSAVAGVVPPPLPQPSSPPVAAVWPSVLPSVVQLPSEGEIITAADAPAAPATGTIPAAVPPVAALLPSASQRVPRRSPASPLMVRVACGVLLLIAAAAFCATDPGQRLISPLISKIHQWNTARAPKPHEAAASKSTEGTVAVSAPPKLPASPTIIPQTAHEEICRRLLTERTQSFIYADLRLLIPTYNLMASQQGLPSQREMSESFRKAYGAVLDPFDQLSLLQTDAEEDFLLVLSGKEALSLEKIIGQPTRPGHDGSLYSRIYTVKAGQRTLSAALFDPFTLILGHPRAVTRATQADPGPQLREARCMFPTTAHRNPGALIMVKRVNVPAPNAESPPTAFETIITNLFITTGTPSTLTLTRNPEVPEKAFVDAAAPALKEQAAALAPSLGADPKSFSKIAPSEINLTLNEATVALPGGPALISSALENMARSFVRTAPTMSTILEAQDAVMRFNTARSTGAETALRASSSREALELLSEGIRGGGRFGGATFTLSSKTHDLDQLSGLLQLDTTVGLVYRPDPEALSDSSLALALKARNYRNAELLISLWPHTNLKAGPDDTAGTAARQVLDWAASPQGRQQGSIMGLPVLTPEEFEGALSHLALTKGALEWKPGQANYGTWVRLVQPDPARDASRLANTFNAATAGGAIPASAKRDLRAALSLITRGVKGRGENAATTYQLDSLTPSELSAASALLTLEDGVMKVTATPPVSQP